MRFTLPVIWMLFTAVHTGSLEVEDERCTLTSRTRTFSFQESDIAAAAIRRAPSERLRGLPVLAFRLETGECVDVASLGGVGSLQELATLIGRRQPLASGT